MATVYHLTWLTECVRPRYMLCNSTGPVSFGKCIEYKFGHMMGKKFSSSISDDDNKMILYFLLWWFMSCSTFQRVSFWGTWHVLLVHDCVIGQNVLLVCGIPCLNGCTMYQSRHNIELLFTNIPTGLSPSAILNNV